MIDADQARAHLRAGIDRFVGQLAGADLAAPVTDCPGWTVRDLVVHLGDVHRWVVHVVTTGEPEEPASNAPADDALRDWYRGTAEALVDLFQTTDPETPVWAFGQQPGTVTFWLRRQAHEVGVHLIDLERAIGSVAEYNHDLALDGIDEVVTMFFPRQVRLGRTPPLTASLGLAPDGSERRWLLSGEGTGPLVRPEATLGGPADVLLLLLWNRVSLTDPRLRLIGSEAAARTVLAAKLVP